MKRFLFLMIFVVGLLTGCDQIDPTQRQEEDCWITLRPSGEITSSESPITKASTEDIYLVQLYRGTTAFALGYFDDIESMSFNLKKGTDKYRIIVSLIKNGKTALESHYSAQTNAIYAYDQGDSYSIGGYWPSSNYQRVELNSVYYNSVGKIRCVFTNGFSLYSCGNNLELYKIEKARINRSIYCQSDDWLYGEITDYSPNGDFETLNVDLKRVGFKLKYELSGVTDGEVTVTIANSDKTFFQETVSSATYESATNFYAFYEARNAWLYADNYSENLTVSVSWLRGIGVTQDLGSTTVQVLRNCLNNIKITLGSDDRSAGMSLSVEPESSIGSSAVTIPLE